jgi:hypothetical protein
LLSASVFTDEVDGWPLRGLRVESPISLPLSAPSPTVAVANGLVVASPVRSAVIETIESIGRNRRIEGSLPDRERVVEIVRLNFPAWQEALRRSEGTIADLLAGCGLDSDGIIPVIRALGELAGRFEPARGTTTLGTDGQFVFQIRLQPRRIRTADARSPS